MREIKFRVWDDKVGFFIRLCETNLLPNNTIGSDLNCVNIMQYTGLKDKNGVDIYEGDVVKCKVRTSNGLSGYICEVKWSEVYCAFVAAGVKRYFGSKPFLSELYLTKVIGNIHQNPELLEK